MDEYFRQYGLIAIFAIIAAMVPVSMIMASRMTSMLGIRPNSPSPVKLETYECGMEALGGRWSQFNFRYYLYALLFLIFDVTAIFIYPWAIELRSFGGFAFLEIAAFLLILGLGWAYAWRKGALEWR